MNDQLIEFKTKLVEAKTLEEKIEKEKYKKLFFNNAVDVKEEY